MLISLMKGQHKKKKLNILKLFLNLCSHQVNPLFQFLNYNSVLQSRIWGTIRYSTTPFPSYIFHTYPDQQLRMPSTLPNLSARVLHVSIMSRKDSPWCN